MAEGAILAPDASEPSPAVRPGRDTTPGSAVPSQARPFGPHRSRLDSRRLDLAVAGLALLVFGFRFWAPSPWRDEAVTVEVTRRSWSELAHLLGNVDLVHAAHYVVMKGLFGSAPPLTAMRAVSVLAAVATTLVLLRLGTALRSRLLGLTSACVFIALPLASRYAQEARSYALVTLLVTAATLALVLACRSGSRWHWSAYGALVVAAAVFHVFAVLAIPVHGLYALAQARADVLVRWTRATFLAGLVLLPLAALAFSQRAQVSWIPPTQNQALWLFVQDSFGATWWLVVVLVAVGGLAARRRLDRVSVFGLLWVGLPAVLLWALSTKEPLFVLRYLAFTLPGLALAIASVAISLGVATAEWLIRRPGGTGGRRWRAPVAVAAAAVLATAVAGFGTQVQIRRTGLGHTENVRGAVELVDRVAFPGDAVLFLPYDLRGIAQAYPDAFVKLDDVALKRSAVGSASLFGTDVREDTLERRLDEHQRVVVLTRPAPPVSRIDAVKLAELSDHFRQVSEMDAWPFKVMVFERRS